MKTRLLSLVLAVAAALTLPACSTSQQAAVKAFATTTETKLGQINAAALEDLESPQGQQLIIDAVSASAGGLIAASSGQEAVAAATAIGGALTVVHDASTLPSVSGTTLQTSITAAGGATASASKLATSVSNLYTAVRGKGVPQKSALAAIQAGLQTASPKTGSPAATPAP